MECIFYFHPQFSSAVQVWTIFYLCNIIFPSMMFVIAFVKVLEVDPREFYIISPVEMKNYKNK